MPQLQPKTGEFYKDTHGGLYQVRGFATDSQTGKDVVIYQALFGSYTTFVRELKSFISEQNEDSYVFTLVQPEDLNREGGEAVKETVMPIKEKSLQELMMDFFDENNFEEKGKILSLIGSRAELDDNIIDNLAASLDVVIDPGSLERRFSELRTCVRTRARFEGMRLRG